MKRTFMPLKKLTAILLSALMMTSVPAFQLSAFAAETENAEVGATSGTTGDCTWTLSSDGVLKISGNGAMEDYIVQYGPICVPPEDDDEIIPPTNNIHYAPWKDLNVVEAVIENGVTNIGDYSFYCCDNLERVTVANSVTSIGDEAFYECNSLNSINVPDSVTEIGDSAFETCSRLESIVIPKGVTKIGGSAFEKCSNLESIVIPGGVTKIDDYTFRNCTRLADVTIPNTVESIGIGAFIYCGKLERITFTDSLTKVGTSAFMGCNSLTDVYYLGTEESWYLTRMTSGNEKLTSAQIHFIILGDIDSDGEVSILDCTAIQKYLVGLSDMTNEQLAAADANGDGDADILDVTHLQLYLADFDVVLGKSHIF